MKNYGKYHNLDSGPGFSYPMDSKNDRLFRQNGSGLRRCSYFDPNVPNGGPRPVSENNKRAAEPWVAMELCALGDLDQCLDSDTRHRREADDLDFDPFDAYENELQDARSNAAVRLADDLALALRQVRPKLPKNVHYRSNFKSSF